MADFPDGFLWGSSTAAHQVEGGNVNNDWWAWEHTQGSTAVEPSGDAIDQYHRYREDFELLAGLGQNAHRLSLEWSRIEPAPGEWSGAALGHYRRVLECLAENELRGLVWSLTPKSDREVASGRDKIWWRNPIVLAAGALALVVILNIIFI